MDFSSLGGIAWHRRSSCSADNVAGPPRAVVGKSIRQLLIRSSTNAFFLFLVDFLLLPLRLLMVRTGSWLLLLLSGRDDGEDAGVESSP